MAESIGRGASVILLAVAVTACTQVLETVYDSPNTATIRNDKGGEIGTYALKALKSENTHGLIRFSGSCISACTLYLAMPTALLCIVPGATFGFHLPSAKTNGQKRVATRYMMDSYPEWVRVWIDSNGGLTENIKIMPYSYAAIHIPPCTKKNI
jgi:hypothetical protein